MEHHGTARLALSIVVLLTVRLVFETRANVSAVEMSHRLMRSVAATSFDMNPLSRLTHRGSDRVAGMPTRHASLLRALYAAYQGDLETSRKALAQESGPVERFWLGCVLDRMRRHEDAVVAWRGAACAQYFETAAYRAFGGGDFVRALEGFRLVTEITPGSAAAWMMTAGAIQNLATAGKVPWRDMLGPAERAVVLAPADAQAHYLFGYALWLSKTDYPRAEKELRWAWDRRRSWTDSYMLGSFLLDEGMPGSEPAKLLEHALSQGPGEDELRAQLLRAYLREGRRLAALNVYRAALRKNPLQASRLRSICKEFSDCE